ncbi:MAG: hypothetical protein CSA62_09430 [Planctomycetota bacterium]|nr:MAG: hypothetical protein CSA62_09430 [Planctomycetota bacterium]
MAKLKWLALMPFLAAALVFGASFLSGPSKSSSPAPQSSRARSAAEQMPAMDLGELGFSLLAVLGLAIGAIWLIKRLQGGQQKLAGTGSIEIKETRHLSAKRAMHIVRVQDRLLLLAETEAGLSTLSDLSPREEDPALLQPMPRITQPAPTEQGAEPRDFLQRRQSAQPQVQPQAKEEAPVALGNFRELLAKLGQGEIQA